MRSAAGQQGVALLTALIITAIASIVAVAMLSQQRLELRRTANVVEFDQAYLLALGMEAWGLEILDEDRRTSRTDHLLELWATRLPPMTVEGALVSGHIEDLQGRFNLNNLVDPVGNVVPEEAERLRRLLRVLGQDDIVDALMDWIDPDSETRFPDGAEDTVYLEKEPPYRAANSPLRHTSELLLVHGVTPELYEALAPHVAALPEHTAVNVNTATVPVLMSLADDMTEGDAERLVADRGEEGYTSLEEFTSHPVMARHQLRVPNLAVASAWFVLRAHVTFERNRVALNSLVHRPQNGPLRVLMRTQGSA